MKYLATALGLNLYSNKLIVRAKRAIAERAISTLGELKAVPKFVRGLAVS